MFNKKKQQRQDTINRQQNIKAEGFDFERISLFFRHQDQREAHQIFDEQTLDDLDFEEVFIALDRTSSAIGQQYMYSKLRTIPRDPRQSQRYDQYIANLTAAQQEEAIIELSTLNSTGAYFIQKLFLGDQMIKPGWFWLIPTLSLALVAALITAVFYSQAVIIALLLAGSNTVIHLWNKNNVMGYANTIPQLLRMHLVSSKLNKKKLFFFEKANVDLSIHELNKIRRWSIFFKWESSSLDDLAQGFEYLLDLIKGAFLIEPMVFFTLLKQIESNKSDIKTIYEAIGELDMAISVATWRKSLPYYSQPEFADSPVKVWEAQKLYHPLIEAPVANDVNIADQKSILLSGSNMSGKTTFIRTVGINALLSQTINTACAKGLALSRFKIYAAIRIKDDLMEGSSYYEEEVRTVRKLADECRLAQFNLFLLDELFKGTNTVERIASGKAVLSYLEDPTNLVFCSTHDLELIDYLASEYNYYHFEEKIEDGQLTFDYQLKKGSLNHTNAIRVLEMNDFPDQITEEAKSLAAELLKMKGVTN